MLQEGLILGLVAALAGAINAVAGGGTMLTFPLLLYVGVSPVVANATSTLALVVGTAGSIFGFRKRLTGNLRKCLATFLPVSIMGGLLGGILLTLSGDQLFRQLVPYLLLFATLLFFGQGPTAKWKRHAIQSQQERTPTGGPVVVRLGIAVITGQTFVAIYGGYFGAGIGILMLATLGFAGLRDIHDMNAIKNVLAAAINAIASIWFVIMDVIDWPRASVMTVGALIGYFLGAHFSQQIPRDWVRAIVLLVGLGIALQLLIAQWIGG